MNATENLQSNYKITQKGHFTLLPLKSVYRFPLCNYNSAKVSLFKISKMVNRFSFCQNIAYLQAKEVEMTLRSSYVNHYVLKIHILVTKSYHTECN